MILIKSRNCTAVLAYHFNSLPYLLAILGTKFRNVVGCSVLGIWQWMEGYICMHRLTRLRSF